MRTMYKTLFSVILFLIGSWQGIHAGDGKSVLAGDSLRTSVSDTLATQDTRFSFYPSVPSWEYFNYTPWHEGFNASLSLFASMGTGSHRPKGVGFGKDISLAYVKPFGNRWAYALATNVNTLDWGSFQWRQASIGGEVTYAVNDMLSFSVTGYKELVHPNTFLPYYRSLNAFRESYDSHFGGAVNLKFSENFFMQVSFGTGK